VSDVERRASRCVSEALREANALRSPDEQLSEDEGTVLLGDGGALDSLGVVNLAVALESAIEREFGQSIGVVGELLGATDPAPFRTVGLLTRFVSHRITAEAP
jgi:acyl carrier protein